ncbi:LexA family transcriptional regulator [Halomonas cupida]|uniref:Phage repressor protein C, contains Cro/C1-type HTH and peptisase s24 domains n=3 Tax=Halomonas cupida TaxID=44933 RepID=A0A1M7KG41_9GAMM|nr:LexA family transcriptional regulator [Halomonas cupida]SHM64305.1 Phage repressor protein C, contains Cro/C1-type HTH and peptisase s24 domains [Halomonas cupida]
MPLYGDWSTLWRLIMPIESANSHEKLAITDQIMQRMREVLEVDSDYKLAKIFGKSTSALSNWRKRGSIPIDECISLSVTHGVSLDWLILGKGPRESGNAPTGSQGLSISASPSEGLCAISMYDIEAAAGDGRSLEQENIESTLYFEGEQLAAQGLDPAHIVGVKVRGDSMESTLADGDWVLVDRSDRPDRPEGVFLLLVDGERRIKRVQRVAGGAWVLISDNSHYQPEMIPPDKMMAVELLGRCVVKIGSIS